MLRRIKYNSPVVLTFALLSLCVLGLDYITDGVTTVKLFCVYRSSLGDILTYPRFFLHVLGHSSLSHYMSNILLMLVIGPALEDKMGSRPLLISIIITAFATGLVQFIFFPGTALLGASGIVFMMIVMLSMTGLRDGGIPITMILVIVLYLGNEIAAGVRNSDNISQLTHIVGGVCGVAMGTFYFKRRRRRRR